MKTMFSRQFALTASLIILSVLLLGLAFRVYIGQYASGMARKTLDHNADVIADLAAAYDSTDALSNSWDVRINLSFASTVSDTNAVICDGSGTVIVCSCSSLACEHLGKQLDADFVHRVSEENKLSATATITGLYPDERFLVAENVISRASASSIGLVLVSSPTAQANEVVSRTTDFFLITGLVVLLLAMLAVSLLARSISRPLADMASAARRFGHGELETRVATGGSNTVEMDELAVAFNNMAQSLEKSERQRREFVANISHELKTPMTTIAGFMDGMLDGTIPPERHPQYMQAVSDEVRRLSRLVRGMLETSRLQSQGIPDARKRVFDICEKAGQVLLSFEQKITARGLAVQVDMPDESVEVFAEADSITQVLYNLIDNAVKFSDGSLGLRVAREGIKVLVTVSNTGPTIPDSELSLIFDRFHKTDKSRSADRDGVGLGLYIVRTIILSHGEDITVTSQGGVTAFTFSLSVPK